MYSLKLSILLFACLLISYNVRAQMTMSGSDADEPTAMSASMGEASMMTEMTMEMTMEDTDDANAASGSSDMEESDSSNSTAPAQPPTSLLTTFIVDIHFLAVDTTVQYLAYHYCNALSPGYIQCAIYNGTGANSRLVATELVVSEDIFKTLDEDERKLWHSHAFAIQNGLFVIPGLPADQEVGVLESVIGTYGKVVDFWHSYLDFPLGAPQLAYGITATNQINETIADQLDKDLNLTTTWRERQQARMNLTAPEKVMGADDWLTSGVYPQYVIKNFMVNGTQ